MKRIMRMVMAAVLTVVLCTGASAENEWECPMCGKTRCEGSCEKDGTVRPEEWECPACGRTNTESFCGKDGTARPGWEYSVGDIVRFGSYEQDNDTSNGAEPIEWQVLGVRDDGRCVLMSVYGLEAKQYNEKQEAVTWETCTLRAWLNGEFYTAAFTAEEQARIVTVTNRNADNASWGTTGGNDTEDKVWLLSLDDVCRYYGGICLQEDILYGGENEQLIAMPTETAVVHGALTLSQEKADKYQNCQDYPLQAGAGWWWVRSPGSDSCNAAYVSDTGYVDTSGRQVDPADGMVRPVVIVSFALSGL